MTSAAAMISGKAGAEGAGTGTRVPIKDTRATLVPTPDAGSVGGRSVATRSLSASPASTSLSCSSSPTLPLAGLLMHDPERIRMRSAAGSNRRRVKDFNDSITCSLCSGYLIEATTVNDCLHTFCRSCIVKYLESNKYCPRCKSYSSKPITAANLRPDRTLRALVYKLVPGLHKSESQRMVQFYAEISSSNNVPFGDDQHLTQGALSLLDDQNFFSPDEPISLSLEYHNDTLAEHSAASAKVPVTYLQCPAAVTVHHLNKFILTKNGLLVGADHIRVEIIYEDEVLPPDFTLMDVAYCFGYKRIAPMRFFYRILIHPTAKPAPTTSTYQRVEGQDKNSTASSSGRGSGISASSHGAVSSPTPTATVGRNGQRQGEPRQQAANGKQGRASGGGGGVSPGKAATVRPREDDANNSPVGAYRENSVGNGGVTGGQPSTSAPTGSGASGNANGTTGKLPPAAGERRSEKPSNGGEKKTGGKVSPSTSAAAPRGGLKVVLVSKASKSEPSSPGESTPPLKASERSADNPASPNGAKEQPAAKETTEPKPEKVSPSSDTVENEKSATTPSTPSELKCYVNLKKQTVVGGAPPTATDKQLQPVVEIPRLKIDLPRLKTKLSVSGERRTPSTGASPPSSSSSSAATSPSSAASAASSYSGASSSSGKSPVWPMGKEEYAKTIGLKPVYAVACVPAEDKHSEAGGSSSHRKRKKGKHSKEAGGSGKRRKLHAEISSQHDASLKMKVKLTEKPPKHERLKSSGNEEEPYQPPTSKTPPSQSTPPTPPQPAPPAPTIQQQKPSSPPVVTKSPPQEVVSSTMPKVIDITKDDDDVKFVNEHSLAATAVKAPARKSPPVETAAPVVTAAPVTSVSTTSSKDKLSEMRAIRHKPMVYIPNLDRSLSADASINSFIESVQAKAQTTPPRPAVTSAAASVVSAMLKPTPALIPASTASTMAGKSQPRTPILSPRTMQSYPPLAYPLTSSATTPAVSAAGSIRSMAPPPMKRSISSDSGHPQQPKMARLDPPSLVAPSHPTPGSGNKQPIHAPMFNFAKGANRAKAAQQAAGSVQPPTQSTDVPYRSPISSTYTKEMVTKKPLPNLLLPPSSVSVTKMSDMVSSSSSGVPAAAVANRPVVEIVRIPPTAPVADKSSLAPFTTPPPPKLATSSGTPKTTRPPPATIPLIKIKKPTPGGTTDSTTVSSSSVATSPPGMTPLMAGMRQKMATGPSGSSILDLSGSRQLSDEVIILDNSPVKRGAAALPEGTKNVTSLDRRNSIPGLKLPRDMIGFPISAPSPVTSSSLVTQTSSPGQKTLAPLPKLTEINRNRNLAVRQPNASIRNIPNPSALAFRGAQSASVTTAVTSSGTIALSAHASTGMSITSSSGGGSLVGSNRTNGNGNGMSTASTLALANMTNSYKNVTTGTQLSNGSSSRTTSNLNGSSDTSVNGGSGNNNNNNNNNNSKLANANTPSLGSPGGGKKTIENVAAVLKATAATATSTSSSTSASSSSTSVANSSSTFSSNTSPSRAASSTTGSSSSTSPSTPTTMTAIATNGGNRANGDGIVTSVTTMASVTGTNGSARTSPASIVNVI